MVWLTGQGPEKNMIRKLVTRTSGKEVYGMGKGFLKIFISQAIAQQKVNSAEDFNNQVDRMTSCVDRSQSLSPATPVIAQWPHEQSGHDGRNGSCGWAQQHGLPLTKGNLAKVTVECQICQWQRPTLGP